MKNSGADANINLHSEEKNKKNRQQELRRQAIQAFVNTNSPIWLTLGVLAIGFCYGGLIWIGQGYKDDKGDARGVEMAVVYLPFMFATFAAVIAGFSVYGEKDTEYESEFNTICFQAGGLMLGLAMLSQVGAQLYSLKHSLAFFPLSLAALTTFLSMMWSACYRWVGSAQTDENGPPMREIPAKDWLIFLRTIVFCIVAVATLILAPVWVSLTVYS